MSDTGRNKTVVTAISKISDRPVAKEACLVVIYGLELGKKFNLNRPQIIIGRSSKADIQIDQEAVSRNHCKIINTGNAIMLRDMGSTNGTYVNDEMIDEYVLRDGDFIKVGRCIFKFLSGNNIENAYHEEIYRLTTVDGLTQVFNRRYFVVANSGQLPNMKTMIPSERGKQNFEIIDQTSNKFWLGAFTP